MSIRMLFEFNNDYTHEPISRRDLASAGYDDAAKERLRVAGVRLLGERHHADKGFADLGDWQSKPVET